VPKVLRVFLIITLDTLVTLGTLGTFNYFCEIIYSMNLIVDVGNTSTKLAIYKDGKKISLLKINEFRCEELERVLSGSSIKRAIISSVKRLPPFIFDLLFANIPYVHVLSYKSQLPFKIEYETPRTLGSDRIAAVAGAYCRFCGENVLIIDSGTAITFDFLYGELYIGGNISPGIDMRFKALNKFTGTLPLLEKSSGFSFPGRNTTDAILAGVIGGVTYEINEYIRTFKKEHKDIKVIITGGDGDFLKDRITFRTFYLPDLVIDGLNYILEYNAK
jgi:type III pantothenate kinase